MFTEKVKAGRSLFARCITKCTTTQKASPLWSKAGFVWATLGFVQARASPVDSRPGLAHTQSLVTSNGPWSIGRVRLDRPSRSRAHFLSTIGKYFLFVRTGIGAPQIDPGDFNRARPFGQWLQGRACAEFGRTRYMDEYGQDWATILKSGSHLPMHIPYRSQAGFVIRNWNCIPPDILKVHYISQNTSTKSHFSIVCLNVKNVRRRFSFSPDINVRRNLKMSGEGFMVRRSKCPAKLKIISRTLRTPPPPRGS